MLRVEEGASRRRINGQRTRDRTRNGSGHTAPGREQGCLLQKITTRIHGVRRSPTGGNHATANCSSAARDRTIGARFMAKRSFATDSARAAQYALAMPGTETRFAVLLFTDIVASTALKARHGVPAYSAALK